MLCIVWSDKRLSIVLIDDVKDDVEFVEQVVNIKDISRDYSWLIQPYP